jgi:capsular exopolysaccharide synthesis family protein
VVPLYSGYVSHSYGNLGRRRLGSKNAALSGKETKEALALITVTRPKSELSESYRALRTAILLSSAKGPPKVLLITSPLPSEGKTTTSINVSTVLAQQGSRVLLIDCDLRRPSIHKILHLPQQPGITALLAGSADEKAVIQQTSVPGLFLIPGGAISPNPTELLSSQTMRSFLTRWQTEYDYVIIDSAPALSVTDAVILSVQVDSVLLVLRAGDTTKTAYRRACGLFGQVNARLLGTVLNGLDVYASDYQYYYYGKYYGGSDHPSKKYYGEHAKVETAGS